MKQIKHIVTAIFLSMFIIAASVTITLAFKPLYYHDVKTMNLAENTGYSQEVIEENYEELIRYNQDITKERLELTLPMSENGRIHFEEVKDIFVVFQYILLPLGLIGGAFGIWKIRKNKDGYDYLKWTSVFTVGVPLVLGALIAMFWDKVFVIFHKIFFNNDYWIFDYRTDPIINLLPDTFFMHCAVMILGLVMAGGVFCFILCKYFAIYGLNRDSE